MAGENNVTRGQKLDIPAATWNTLLAVAKDFRRGKPLHTPGLRGGVDAQLEVFVRNDTGAALAEFAVVGLNDAAPLVSAVDLPFEFAAGPVVGVLEPTKDTDQPAVTLEPIPDGAIGRAAIFGAVPCTVDVWDAAAAAGAGAIRPGDYLQCVPGATTFVKAREGPARLLWYKPVSTGDHGPRRGVALLGADGDYYDFEAVTDANFAFEACELKLTVVYTRFRKGQADAVRHEDRFHPIPSKCVEVFDASVAPTATTTCVSGVATTTFTFAKVKIRVLDCEACS